MLETPPGGACSRVELRFTCSCEDVSVDISFPPSLSLRVSRFGSCESLLLDSATRLLLSRDASFRIQAIKSYSWEEVSV